MIRNAVQHAPVRLTQGTLLLLLSLSLCWLPLGCGGDDDPNPGDQGDSDLVTDGDTESDSDGILFGCDVASGYDDISGPWGLKFAIAYTTVFPIFGKVQLVLVGIEFMDVEQTGTDLSFSEHICSLDMNIVEDKGLEIIFPDVAVEHIPIRQRQASLTSLEKGATFQTEEFLDLYGADESLFTDPQNDPLPEEPEDTEVVDFDEDGKPGLTARLNGAVQGEVYVVMRFWREFIGEMFCGGKAEGLVDSTVEMMTIGSDTPVLDIQLDLVRQENADLHRFEMIKLPQALTCEELVAQQQVFFSYDPMSYAVPLDEEE